MTREIDIVTEIARITVADQVMARYAGLSDNDMAIIASGGYGPARAAQWRRDWDEIKRIVAREAAR